MRSGWGERELDLPAHPVAGPAARRRAALAEAFPGERLVLPAGTFKVRSYDTDYRFRPDTAHTYFSGNQTSDAVLVVEAIRRVGPLRATAVLARDRRVLPGPAVRRAVGRSPAVARGDVELAGAARCGTSTSSRARSAAPASPACTAASPPSPTGC